MLRPDPATRSIWRILGMFMVVASVVLVSPTATHAQRSQSPYAFEDPDVPGTEVAGTNAGTTSNPKAISPTPDVVDQAGPTVSPLLPAVAETDVPAVAGTDVPGQAGADPEVNPRGMKHGGLANTGAQGLTARIAFAMVLVAIGLLAREASGRRRASAR